MHVRMYLAEASAGRKTVRGFTLVELLVVIAIVSVITGIVFTSQSSFNKSLVLANTAYDIALTLRSAESFGIASRVVAATANAGYGIHFTSNEDSYILFTDTNTPSATGCHGLPPYGDATTPDAQPGNCAYDSGEFVRKYTLNNGITIGSVYADGTSAGSLDIVFARPNPDAFMSKDGIYQEPPFSIAKACITVVSPQGGVRYIKVEQSGAISTSMTSCI